MKKLVVAAFLGFPAVAVALAHPGHGTTDPQSVQHQLVEPQHLMVAFAAVSLIGIGVAVWKLFKQRSLR